MLVSSRNGNNQMPATVTVSTPTRAGRFVWLVSGVGTLALLPILDAPYDHPVQTCAYAVLGALAARLRLRQVIGAVSFGLLFVLLGIQDLTLAEVLLTGCVITAAQSMQRAGAARVPAPLAFHLANTAIGINLSYQTYHSLSFGPELQPLAVTLAAAVLYGWVNTAASAALAAAQRLRLSRVLRECGVQTLPHFSTSVFLATLLHAAEAGGPLYFAWALPPVALLAYSMYLAELNQAAARSEIAAGLEDLHNRTLESLALAIEARDLTSAEHLRRMQTYCAGIGRHLNLPAAELEALRIASLLHDIGKLAVPEHVLRKGTRLTREEFDAVKIHAGVGADIIDRIKFPVPVAEIVRSHHERWNGTGYPDGLKGAHIPMGARILSVVDALEALRTDKPYRAALALDEAVDRLSGEAGIHFDPNVIEALTLCYQDLETSMHNGPHAAIEDDLQRLRRAFGGRPPELPQPLEETPQFLTHIAQSREEARLLLDMTRDLSRSLQLDESLPAVAARLATLVPFETIVVYARDGDILTPRYAAGASTSIWMSRQTTLGHGVVGRAAQSGEPLLNSALAGEFPVSTSLHPVGLAVPLPGASGPVGVLLLTLPAPHQFTADHLRVVSAIRDRLGAALENGISYEQARLSAGTDFLTGLPNARSLHQHLESELSRCRRLNASLTVMMADLDGFKEVNDRYGHLEGNRLLQSIARHLRQACRDYDYVARLGGDEFVFILPGLPESDSELKITQLTQAVADAARSVVPESSLGLSVGKSRFPEDGSTAEELLLHADQEMYRAKTARKQAEALGSRAGFNFDTEGLPAAVDY